MSGLRVTPASRRLRPLPWIKVRLPKRGRATGSGQRQSKRSRTCRPSCCAPARARSSACDRGGVDDAVPFVPRRRPGYGLGLAAALRLDGRRPVLRAQRVPDRFAGAEAAGGGPPLPVPRVLPPPCVPDPAGVLGGAGGVPAVARVPRGAGHGTVVEVRRLLPESVDRLRPLRRVLARVVAVRRGTFLSGLPAAGVAAREAPVGRRLCRAVRCAR